MIYLGVEITKLHERQLRGTVENVYDKLNKNPDYTLPSLKGEITVVIAPYHYAFNSEIQPSSSAPEKEEAEVINTEINLRKVILEIKDFMDIDRSDLV